MSTLLVRQSSSGMPSRSSRSRSAGSRQTTWDRRSGQKSSMAATWGSSRQPSWHRESRGGWGASWLTRLCRVGKLGCVERHPQPELTSSVQRWSPCVEPAQAGVPRKVNTDNPMVLEFARQRHRLRKEGLHLITEYGALCFGPQRSSDLPPEHPRAFPFCQWRGAAGPPAAAVMASGRFPS